MKAQAIDIHSINAASLREGQFRDALPEYYALAGVTENGAWHLNQTVFDHAVAVMEGLESVLRFTALSAGQFSCMTEYLTGRIGNSSRLDVLVAATVLHDIAKKDTLIRNADGTTRCPGHELIGAARVKSFSARFGFAREDQERAERIVLYHGLIAEVLVLTIVNGSREKYLSIFMETVGDVAIELVLLMQADLLGSHLARSDRSGFDARMALLDWMLAAMMPERP